MVVVPCRRLWDPRSSRLRRGPSRAPRRHPRDPHLSKKSRGSTIGHSTSGDPHLGQSPPGTPGCRAGTPRWYSTEGPICLERALGVCQGPICMRAAGQGPICME